MRDVNATSFASLTEYLIIGQIWLLFIVRIRLSVKRGCERAVISLLFHWYRSTRENREWKSLFPSKRSASFRFRKRFFPIWRLFSSHWNALTLFSFGFEPIIEIGEKKSVMTSLMRACREKYPANAVYIQSHSSQLTKIGYVRLFTHFWVLVPIACARIYTSRIEWP